MVRIHRGSPKLGRTGDILELVTELGAMTDYLQLCDRDAAHLIAAMNFDRAAFARGLETKKVTMRATKILRMFKLGQGREFGRSPEAANDDGMSSIEVEVAINELALMAVRAEIAGRAVLSVLIFDEKLIAPNK